MRKQVFRKKGFWLAAAALALVGAAGADEAMAYFTTNVTAAGGHPVTLGYETDIEEDVSDMTKHIVITNTGETDCYVRVKVFGGSQFEIAFTAGSGWSQEADGYWYYSEILPAGGETSELLAKIQVPEDYTDTFNIVVVQECTPVLYNEDGTPRPADWERTVSTTTDIGTAAGEE